eukprot:superscaffoldBa00010591_g24789
MIRCWRSQTGKRGTFTASGTTSILSGRAEEEEAPGQEKRQESISAGSSSSTLTLSVLTAVWSIKEKGVLLIQLSVPLQEENQQRPSTQNWLLRVKHGGLVLPG